MTTVAKRTRTGFPVACSPSSPPASRPAAGTVTREARGYGSKEEWPTSEQDVFARAAELAELATRLGYLRY